MRCDGLRALALWAMCALLCACEPVPPAHKVAAPLAVTPPSQPSPSTDAMALGRMIFHDTRLSASGKQSCASCHDPAHAHAQPNSLAVQMGGAQLDLQGKRAVPSLRYLAATPAFGMDAEQVASGGFNHDGSAHSLAQQMERPLLAANEMANLSKQVVVEKLRSAPYAAQFKQVYGEHSLERVEQAFKHMGEALEQYQKTAPELQPFNSKYDAYLAGKEPLSAAELRGLKLFNAKDKGNCAACHPSARQADGSPPLFTDFSYDALGVPRNAEIAANADPSYFDQGLCQAGRSGQAAALSACGKFKVPTLRNVATRQVFFHNGQIKQLRTALAFYVQRDTQPELWYPRDQAGRVIKFDDLPPAQRRNVNRVEVPYERKLGAQPGLSDQEIDDVLAFLKTLTDRDLAGAP